VAAIPPLLPADPMGDLMFNGISPWAAPEPRHRVQGDGSFKWRPSTRCAPAFLVQRERCHHPANAQTLPVDDAGAPTTDVPQGTCSAPTWSAALRPLRAGRVR